LSPAPNKTPFAQESTAPIDGMTPSAAGPAAARRPNRLLLAAIAALVVGYAALSHYSASSPNAKGLGAALSVAPILLIGLILAWRWTRPFTALLIAAAACAILYRYWPAIEKNYEWGDLVQQCGVYALIAASFARSLFAGRVPVCTQLATAIHGALTPVEVAYTRRATGAWAVFYCLTAAAILVLFFVASLRVWSLFDNFGVFGLMIVMGLADHAVRRRVLPRHPGGGILAILQRALIG
jgi:uncharacterized membrane protein